MIYQFDLSMHLKLKISRKERTSFRFKEGVAAFLTRKAAIGSEGVYLSKTPYKKPPCGGPFVNLNC